MVKKVFAIIGVILGSVIALAGAVIGVMAAMGKFKEPIVYPKSLIFEQGEIVVDSTGVEFGTKKIQSFVLTGVGSGSNKVNKKTCYISFEKGNGIITLCDKLGNPLQASSGNKFKVNCNEPIYYYINYTNVGNEYVQKTGVVEISATDEKGTVPSNKLKILVDNEIENILFNKNFANSEVLSSEIVEATENTSLTQNLYLAIGGKLYIDYVVTPNNALQPISGKDEKTLELYYNDVKSGDHYLVNSETAVSNLLKDFIKYDANLNKYYITSEYAGQFSFKIAYFKTYNQQSQFEADYANEEMPTGYNKVREMEYTTVNVFVENTSVTNIQLTSGEIFLNLYLDNQNYITLNQDNMVDGKQNNNIGLIYEPSNIKTSLRYNEALFVEENNLGLYDEVILTGDEQVASHIKYTSNSNIVKVDNLFYLTIGDDTLTLKSEFDGKMLNIGTTENPRYVISSITSGSDANIVNYSTNGLAVVEYANDAYVLKLLQTGTYMDFYLETADATTYTYAKWQNYQAEEVVGEAFEGRKRTWKVVAEEIPEEKLTFAVLVINTDGEYFFKTVSVRIAEYELEAGSLEFFNNKQHSLEVGFVNDGAVADKTEKGILELYEIFEVTTNVSYKECVLFTPKAASYSISVIESVVYSKDGTDYVLVGYFTEADDVKTFVNQVRIENKLTTFSTPVYVAQLKTEYNQTAIDLISKILNEQSVEEPETQSEEPAEEGFVNKFFKTHQVNIQTNYNLSILTDSNSNFNSDFVTLKYDSVAHHLEETDDVVKLVQEGEYSVTLLLNKEVSTATNVFTIGDVFDAIWALYSNNVVELFSRSHANIEIVEVAKVEVVKEEKTYVGFKIDFRTLNPLTTNSIILLNFEYNGLGAYGAKFKPIEILSNRPTSVVFELSDDLQHELANSVDLAKNTEKLVVEISYNNGFAYKWFYKKSGETHEIEGFNFEKISSFFVRKDSEDYTIGWDNLSYKVFTTEGHDSTSFTFTQDGDIFVPNINKVEDVVVEVDVNGFIQKYIYIEVVQDGNFKLSTPTDANDVKTTFYALAAKTYAYNETSLNQFLTINNVKAKAYSDETKFVKDGDIFKLIATNSTPETEDDVDILEISNSTGNWVFTRINDKFSILNLEVEVSSPTNGNLTFDLRFNPDLSVAINTTAGWSSDLTFYQGTTVKLYDIGENLNAVESSKAVFKIVDTEENVTVKLYDTNKLSVSNAYVADNEISFNKSNGAQTPYYTFANCGKDIITIAFFKGDNNPFKTLRLTVVPNVVAVVTNTTFVGASGVDEQEFFDLYSYNDLAYGNTVGAYSFELHTIEYSGLISLVSNVEGTKMPATSSGEVSPSVVAEFGKVESEQISLVKENFKQVAKNTTFEANKFYNSSYILLAEEPQDWGSDDAVYYEKEYLNIIIYNNPYYATVLENTEFEVNKFFSLNQQTGEYTLLTEKPDDWGQAIYYVKSAVKQKVNIVDVEIHNPYELTFTNSQFRVCDTIANKIGASVTIKQKFEGLGLSNLDVSNLEIYYNGEKITSIDSHISERTGITLTFKLGVYTATNLQFDIYPYLPALALSSDSKIFEADEEYDAIKNIFGEDQDAKIERITLVGVENVNDLNYFSSLGVGNAEYTAQMDIKPLVGENSHDVTLIYSIVYVGGTSYEDYKHTITIKNKDNPTTVYPYAGTNITTTAYNDLISVEDADKQNPTICETLSLGTQFEPVIIGQTVDLWQSWNGVQRVNIESSETTSISKIEVEAISNFADLKSYYLNNFISINGTKITFNQANGFDFGSFGFIKFKYTTTNGAVGTYLVKLFNQIGAVSQDMFYNNINVNNNVEIAVTPTENTYFNWVETNAATSIYAMLQDNDGSSIKAIEGTEINMNSQFANKNFESSYVEMYLLNVESPSEVRIINNTFVVDGTDTKLTQYQRLNGEELGGLDAYATLTVALVHNRIDTQFCFGTVSVHVQPTAILQANSLVTENNDGYNSSFVYVDASNNNQIVKANTATTNYKVIKVGDHNLKYQSGLNNGVFTHTLSTDVTKYVAPFADVASIEIIQNGSVVEKDSTNVTTFNIISYVETEYNFAVVYTLNSDVEVKINFTIEPFELDITAMSKTTGKFNTASGTFENTIALTDLIGASYTKEIDITIYGSIYGNYNIASTEEISYSWTADSKGTVTFDGTTFTFAQLAKKYTVDIEIKFKNYQDKVKTITVTVLPGIYVNNSIVLEATPTGYYNDVVGSNLTLTNADGVYKFTTPKSEEKSVIYLANGVSGLTFNFVHTKENVTDNGTSYALNYFASGIESGNKVTQSLSDSNLVVQFVHLAQAKELQLDFNITGAEMQCQTSESTQTGLRFKTVLPQTYSGLQAQYLTTGATHENVFYGEWGTSDYSVMFEDISSYTTNVDVNETQILNKNRVLLLGLTLNANQQYQPITQNFNFAEMGFANSSNPNYVRFDYPSCLTVKNEKLTFNEIDGQKTGIVYLTMNNFAGVENFEYALQLNESAQAQDSVTFENNKSASYIATDYLTYLAQTNNGKLEVAEHTLANMVDASCSTFFISNFRVNNGDAVISEDCVSTPEGYIKRYTITNNGITYTFTLTSSGEIKFAVSGDASFAKLTISFDMYGDTAKAKTFTIHFYNYSQPASTTETTKPDEGVDVAKIAKLTTTVANPGVSFTYNVSPLDEYSKYVNVIGSNVVPNNVSEDTSIVVLCTVKHVDGDDVIIVKEFNFTITIQSVIVFKVNGQTLKQGSNTFTSTYELKNATLTFDESPATQSLTDSNATLISGKFPATQSLTDSNETLNFEYFKKGNKQGSSAYSITLLSEGFAQDNSAIEFNDNTLTLTFKKDISTLDENTDYIRLKMSVPTADGAYEAYWIIYFTGIETIDYVSGDEKTVLSNSSAGFTPGSLVDLISDSPNTTETNIKMTKNYANPVEVSANIRYAINSFDGTTTIPSDTKVEDLCYSEDNELKPKFNNEKLQVYLPVVPKTDNGKFYIVTYRIKLSYLGISNNEYVYYVSYAVYNNQALTPNVDYLTINPDDLTENKLLLANVSAQYNKNGETIFEIKIDKEAGGRYYAYIEYDGKYKLSDNSSNEWKNGNNSIVFTQEQGKSTYSATIKVEDSGDESIGGLTYNFISNHNDNHVFSADGFSNIEYFLTVINQVENVRLSNMTGCVIDSKELLYTFKFDSDSQSFYIKLDEKGTLFTNTLEATLGIYSSGKDIYSADIVVKPENAISALNSIELGKIFSGTQLGKNASSLDSEGVKLNTLPIIGVFNNSSIVTTVADGWIKFEDTNGDGELDPNEKSGVCTEIVEVSEFNEITHDSMIGNYKLYEVYYEVTSNNTLYSLTSNNTLYSLTAKYYAIGSSTGNITLVDYANGGEGSVYPSTYKYNAENNQSLNLSSVIKQYTGAMEESTVDIEQVNNSDSNGIITISNSELARIKLTDTTKTFIDVEYSVKTSAGDLKLKVRWYLPDIVVANYQNGETAFTCSGTTLNLTNLFTCYKGTENFTNSASAKLTVTGNDSVYDSSTNTLSYNGRTFGEVTYTATWDHDNNAHALSFEFTVIWEQPQT